jgi:hypothetical protein
MGKNKKLKFCGAFILIRCKNNESSTRELSSGKAKLQNRMKVKISLAPYLGPLIKGLRSMHIHNLYISKELHLYSAKINLIYLGGNFEQMKFLYLPQKKCEEIRAVT